MQTVRICSRCGAPMPPDDAPAELCPNCLSSGPTPTDSALGATGIPHGPRPVPGERFGDYRILRLLGRGGMGEVFEADHLPGGRRVALKVMNHALASDADRKRFLREGRLAASVSHTNVIYVYGSEEIHGIPVIAMELVHEGTLRDRVRQQGPLPMAEAVDDMLQIIAGLESVEQAGVLHRDIKPANCFVSFDGTVKIGDFGLSISTVARTDSLLTASGSILGTPGFASPEQLRGEPLLVQSDIYSLGATLYYLVTGQMPFPAQDLVNLIASVLNHPPAPPARQRPDLPSDLNKLILRCLAKEPSQRFDSYRELSKALLPFSSHAPTPAKPGSRILASLIDDFIVFMPGLCLLLLGKNSADGFAIHRDLASGLVFAGMLVWRLLYYACCEGFWGGGPGKMLLGLRVADLRGNNAGFVKALQRAMVFALPDLLPTAFAFLLYTKTEYANASRNAEWILTDFLFLPLLLALFFTARRRNGYAALHDLVSHTWVMVEQTRESRPAVPAPTFPSHARAVGKLGPYDILEDTTAVPPGKPIQAYDSTLRRNVWIVLHKPEEAPVPSRRRDLSRSTRLRWLNGSRTDAQAWDAYEAPAGQPLLNLLQLPQPWAAVRFWLQDIADEFAHRTQDDPPPARFSLDRIWITADGRAVLLEFVCPGLEHQRLSEGCPGIARDLASLQQRLTEVAQCAAPRPAKRKQSGIAPPPLSGLRLIQRFRETAFDSIELVQGNIRSHLQRHPTAAPRLRMNALGFPIACALALSSVLTAQVYHQDRGWDQAWHRLFPDTPSLRAVLGAGTLDLDPHQPNPVQLYAGQAFGRLLTNQAFWTEPGLGETLSDAERQWLTNAVQAARNAEPEFLNLHAAAGRLIADQLDRHQDIHPALVGLGTFCGTLLAIAPLSLLALLVLGQPLLLHLMGLVVINRQGNPARRGQLLLRWLLGWLPAMTLSGGIAAVVSMTAENMIPSSVLVTMAKFTPVILGALAAAFMQLHHSPWQSWQETISRTWVVPR